MKVLLNAVIARKNGGGALQIVFNFLNATLVDESIEWFYLISDELEEILKNRKVILPANKTFVVKRQPNLKTYFATKRQIYNIEKKVSPNLVYSILAPSYHSFRSKEIMRCCNAWDVNPTKTALKALPFKQYLFMRLKSALVRHLMRRACYFITQTELSKSGIHRATGLPLEHIKVVPNVLPMTYHQYVVKKTAHDGVNIVYVASPAPHKQIECGPRLLYYLKERYHIKDANIILTIPFSDKAMIQQLNREGQVLGVSNNIKIVGYLSQPELVDLYSKCDIAFFPSLLETFSATLLEYMYFNLPIVASDYGFNKEVTGDAALYFEPQNIEDAASKITQIINNKDLRIDLERKMYDRLQLFKDYSKHYNDTTAFFKMIISKI